MSKYKELRSKKWNKSGCDPYNMGIPAKLYGCGEKWRYDLPELQKPNPQNYYIGDFNRVYINVESPGCKNDGYILNIWNVLDGVVTEHIYNGRDIMIDGLVSGQEYNFYIVGFRDEDNAKSKPSDILSIKALTTGAYNKFVDSLCDDSGEIDCSNYLKF